LNVNAFVMVDDLSDDEFRRLLDEEVVSLDPEIRAVYDRYAVPPERLMDRTDAGRGPFDRPIWVFLRAADRLGGYDEIEEEFGTGVPGPEGYVVDWGTYGGRLRWLLLRFPDPHRDQP
jgi:hypothetical protein